MLGKENRKEKWKKNKMRSIVNKLFLYANSNSFHLFFSSCKFLTNFNYILFSFIFSIIKPNEKIIFLTIFFFFL